MEADTGSRLLQVTLRTHGEQTLTVTGTANGAIVGEVKVNVVP